MLLMIIPETLESTHYTGFIEVAELPEELRAKLEADAEAVEIEGDYSVRWETDFDGTFAKVSLGNVTIWTKDGRSFKVPAKEVNAKDILEWLEGRVDKYHQPESYYS